MFLLGVLKEAIDCYHRNIYPWIYFYLRMKPIFFFAYRIIWALLEHLRDEAADGGELALLQDKSKLLYQK